MQVTLNLKTNPLVEIPAEALFVKGDKAFAAVVTADNKVSFRPVIIADSDAKTARISSGLVAKELVVLNPGWGISEGDHIKPVFASK